MDNNNNSGSITIGLGIPSVVVGVLIALKKVGMTAMSYSDILWFGAKVLLVCVGIALVLWFVAIMVAMFFTSIREQF